MHKQDEQKTRQLSIIFEQAKACKKPLLLIILHYQQSHIVSKIQINKYANKLQYLLFIVTATTYFVNQEKENKTNIKIIKKNNKIK